MGRNANAGGVAAVVLAAGTGSRYRAVDPAITSKLLVEIDRKALVRHVTEAALVSRARPVIVVTGHAADAVAQVLAGLEIDIVHNADFARGLAGSLKTGIAALPASACGALVLLGDMPAVGASLLDGLAGAFAKETGLDAVVPTCDGRRGNPVLLGRRLFGAVGRLDGDEGARRLLAGARVREIETGDPAILTDIDEPAALLAAVRRGSAS